MELLFVYLYMGIRQGLGSKTKKCWGNRVDNCNRVDKTGNRVDNTGKQQAQF